MRARHAAYFLELVQRAEPGVLSGERDHWQNRLELELENLRASRAWFVACGDVESLLRLNGYLFLLLAYRGYASEGRGSLLEALAMSGGSPATRARALHCLALLAYLQADYAAAAEHGQQSLALREQIGNAAELAWSLLECGTTAVAQADLATGRSLLQRACEASRRSHHVYLLAYSVALLASIDYLEGDIRAARRRAGEAVQLGNAFGLVAPTSHALATQGESSYLESDRQVATRFFQRALETARAPGEVLLRCRPTLGLALIAADQGDVQSSRVLFSRSIELGQRLANPHRIAQSLEGVSIFAALQTDLAAAWRLAGAASAIRDRLGAPLSPTERRLLQQRLGSPRSRGSVSAFDEGRTCSLDRACTLAHEFLASQASSQSVVGPGHRQLTARERQVAVLIAHGQSNRQIAESLMVAERTATSHVEHVLSKLGFHARAQIATWVTRQILSDR